MRSTMTRRPSPALVVSVIALIVAISGSAYAALGKNTVGSREVKRNTLKSGDLKNDKAVKGDDVVDDSLTGSDLDEETLSLPAGLGANDVQAFGNAASADTVITTGTFVSVLSKPVTAPRDGFLFIVGSITGCDGSGVGRGILDFRLRLDSRSLDTGIDHEIDSGQGSGTGFSTGCETGGTTRVVPVSAGRHTVHLEAAEGSSGTNIIGRDLSVLFAPRGSGVSVP